MIAQKLLRRSAGLCLLAAALVVCVVALPAAGQDGRGARVYQEQLRVRLDQQSPVSRDISVDGGGWFTFAFFQFDDAGERRTRTLRQYELRGWASASIHGVHRAYVRGLMGYNDWNSGQNPDEPHGDQYTGCELERAWYSFDLGQLLQNRTGQESPLGLKVTVGRQYAEIGTAFVLSMPLDMVKAEASFGDWRLTALLGKTIHETRNIDDSDLVSDHQRRCFWGVELGYTGFDRHRPFAYYLQNHDDTRPERWDPFQSYDYSSRYVGIGSTGSLILPNLRYQAEAVGEFGDTYSAGVVEGRDEICAMGVDVLLEYLFPMALHPKISFEYMWGSGDKDRNASATTTVQGNRAGTTDHAFNAFGYRDTGLAFAPRISNLHIYTAGASFFPLERTKRFKKMEVGTKAFLYHRSASSGAISDVTATNDNATCAGWEWDVYADWRITSDLSWTIRYGAFFPGRAFDDRSCRQFLMTAVILNF